MPGVWLFSRRDAIGYLGMIAASALVGAPNDPSLDPIVNFAVAGLFLQSAWSITNAAHSNLRQADK